MGLSRYTASECSSSKEPFRGYPAHSPDDGGFLTDERLDGGQQRFGGMRWEKGDVARAGGEGVDSRGTRSYQMARW